MTWVLGIGVVVAFAGVLSAISTDIGEIRRAAKAGESPRRGSDRGDRPPLRLVHPAPGARVIAFPPRPEPTDDAPLYPEAA